MRAVHWGGEPGLLGRITPRKMSSGALDAGRAVPRSATTLPWRGTNPDRGPEEMLGPHGGGWPCSSAALQEYLLCPSRITTPGAMWELVSAVMRSKSHRIVKKKYKDPEKHLHFADISVATWLCGMGCPLCQRSGTNKGLCGRCQPERAGEAGPQPTALICIRTATPRAATNPTADRGES